MILKVFPVEFLKYKFLITFLWLLVSLMIMAWITFNFYSPKDPEILSDYLIELGALSVDLEDLDKDTDHENPIFDNHEPQENLIWTNSLVHATFEDNTDIESIIEKIRQNIEDPPPRYEIATLLEQDWVKITQEQFPPILIQADNKKLQIVPTWHRNKITESLHLIIDPGLAFGTGTHPTTELCLKWLMNQDLSQRHVLDYGCGSGILAITAKKLGAKQVWGMDIDPQSIQVSRDNALQNKVDVSFDLVEKSLEKVDIIIANILTNTLIVLAPVLASHCTKNSHIVLSGILIHQTQQVIDAYNPFFQMTCFDQKEDWALLTGKRRAFSL